MLGYKFKDSFSFLPETRADKRLYDISLISSRDLLRRNRKSNALSIVITHHFRPTFHRNHLSKHIKPFEKPTSILFLCSTLFYHTDSCRLRLKTESCFFVNQAHSLPFCGQQEFFSTSCQTRSFPSNFGLQLSTASRPITEHFKMIFSPQEPEESLRHEIRPRFSDSSQPSEEALAVLLFCSQRLTFLCVLLMKKVHGPFFGRTINKSTILSAY